MQACPRLIERFKEREENVKVMVLCLDHIFGLMIFLSIALCQYFPFHSDADGCV
jgi:hypothetical protein